MFIPRMLWGVLLAISLGWSHAVAAETIARALTLSDAIATALTSNPQVVAARSALDAAHAQAKAARGPLRPQVTVSETINHTNSPLWAFGTKLNQGIIETADFNPDSLNAPDAVTNFNTALSVSWTVYDGGGSRIGIQQARQTADVQRMALLRTEQQVIAHAAKAYVGLLLAAENLNVIDQSLETASAHLKLVQDRFRSGVSVKSDVLRAQVRIADLEQQRFSAQSHVQVAQAMLHAAMGETDTGPLNPLTPFRRCVSPSGKMADWIALALDHRPDLMQIAMRKNIAERQIRRARAGHYPSLALQGNYEINAEDLDDNQDNFSIGAVLRVNLYSGGRISAQAEAAAASAANVRAIGRGAELGVRVETQRAYYQLHSAWKSIAVARQAVDQAEEGLRIVSNRYGSGLLTIVDLLDAQVALQQASTRHFKAMHDYKVARIELALAAGTIDKTFK